MARYGPAHKQETRSRILEAAGGLFREQGYAATGIKQVMKACGLTVGGFYAHFESKEALLVEMMKAALEQTGQGLFVVADEHEGNDWIREVVRFYLSHAHRDAAGMGCALPSLTAEVTRASDEARAAFEADFVEMLSSFENKAPPIPSADMDRTDRALATVALSVGGLLLARAVKSRTLSDRILMACKKMAIAPEEER